MNFEKRLRRTAHVMSTGGDGKGGQRERLERFVGPSCVGIEILTHV